MENKERQYRSNQGRRPSQLESSNKIAVFVSILLLGTMIIGGIINAIMNVLG